MKIWYAKLSHEQKEFVWLAVIAIIGLIATTPLFFIDVPANYSYFFGWLLGSVAELIGFASIVFFGNAMVKASQNPESKAGPLAALTGILRLAFYAGVLVISAICTFRKEWFGGFDAFNFWTCFGGLLPLNVVMIVFHLVHKDAGSSGFSGASK